MGKGEIARYKQFLLFPQCLQKVSLCGNGLTQSQSQVLIDRYEGCSKNNVFFLLNIRSVVILLFFVLQNTLHLHVCTFGLRYFLYTTTLCLFYLSFHVRLLSFVISYTDKHEFSYIFSCCNDIMNHVDCIIKRDAYPQKMHSCSKNICGISVFVLKIPVVYTCG